MSSTPTISLITLSAFVPMMSCVEPYQTKSIQFERIVVVDGLLTDQAGTHVVDLRYTTPIDTSYHDPITNADVWIAVGDGTREVLEEVSTGKYQTSPDYQGVPGQNYQLVFITSEGKTYQSDLIELIGSPPIDSIYHRFAELPDAELNKAVPGMQFFLDSHDDSGLATFFRYEWTETFQIIPHFPSRYFYDVETGNIVGRTEETDQSVCYQTNDSNNLNIFSSIGSKEDRVTEVPLRYVSNVTPILRNRYTIEGTQYAISEGAFNYYRKLKESQESSGSLFDKQVGTLTGNVHSVDDGSEPVLGFFEVAGVTKKRAFFTHSDFDRRMPRAGNFYNCTPNNDIITSQDYAPVITDVDTIPFLLFLDPRLDTMNRINETYYVIDLDLSDGVFISIGPTRCTICDYYATTEEPDFWPAKFY